MHSGCVVALLRSACTAMNWSIPSRHNPAIPFLKGNLLHPDGAGLACRDMEVDDAIELGQRAIYHATFRDAVSGGTVSGEAITHSFAKFREHGTLCTPMEPNNVLRCASVPCDQGRLEEGPGRGRGPAALPVLSGARGAPLRGGGSPGVKLPSRGAAPPFCV